VRKEKGSETFIDIRTRLNNEMRLQAGSLQPQGGTRSDQLGGETGRRKVYWIDRSSGLLRSTKRTLAATHWEYDERLTRIACGNPNLKSSWIFRYCRWNFFDQKKRACGL